MGLWSIGGFTAIVRQLYERFYTFPISWQPAWLFPVCLSNQGLEEADKLRAQGNEFFNSGDFETARQRYYGAIWHLDFDIGQQWNLMDKHQLDLNTRCLGHLYHVIFNSCHTYRCLYIHVAYKIVLSVVKVNAFQWNVRPRLGRIFDKSVRCCVQVVFIMFMFSPIHCLSWVFHGHHANDCSYSLVMWAFCLTFPLFLQPWKFYITAWYPVVPGNFTSLRGDVALSR